MILINFISLSKQTWFWKIRLCHIWKLELGTHWVGTNFCLAKMLYFYPIILSPKLKTFLRLESLKKTAITLSDEFISSISKAFNNGSDCTNVSKLWKTFNFDAINFQGRYQACCVFWIGWKTMNLVFVTFNVSLFSFSQLSSSESSLFSDSFTYAQVSIKQISIICK